MIGWMQLRQRPEPRAYLRASARLGQPFADVVKLLLKEVIIPVRANKVLFIAGAGARAHSGLCNLGRDSACRPTSSSPTSMPGFCTYCR